MYNLGGMIKAAIAAGLVALSIMVGYFRITVPRPRPEDAVLSFFRLVDQGKAPEAIRMMDQTNMSEEEKEAWVKQFADLEEVEVVEVEKTANKDIYRVRLNVRIRSDAAEAPIPYFGWGPNPNLRYVAITEKEGVYKIKEIATGP